MEKAVVSPCNNECYFDKNTKFCRSCCRTLEEITSWLNISNIQRKKIKEKAIERKKAQNNE